MPKNVVVEGELASCGDVATGSKTVFVGTVATQSPPVGITRAGKDLVGGGLIKVVDGRTVFVEGFPVSLPGDPITSHGSDAHAAATTLTKNVSVFVGT